MPTPSKRVANTSPRTGRSKAPTRRAQPDARLQALAWYRGRGIPALGDATAEALVRRDQAHVVRAWLDAYAAGAHA